MHLQLKREHKFATVVLIVLAVVNIARGLFHYLAPDSGSHAVAGMALSPDVVYLLAIIGALQFINGLLFLYIALKQKRLVLVALLYELLVNGMVLLLNFCFKQPSAPVPGRFSNIAIFVIILITAILVMYREAKADETNSG